MDVACAGCASGVEGDKGEEEEQEEEGAINDASAIQQLRP
jgi:hypothetical protein